MKPSFAAIFLTLAASTAQADLLTRWEVAEEALTERVFDLAGNSAYFTPWSDQDRTGKACLLSAMLESFGDRRVEGYVASLEQTAAARMSYPDTSSLSLDWMMASSRNNMDLNDVMDLALGCNSSF